MTSIEIYIPERRAEFLLSNTVDDIEYNEACKEVIAMGLKPEEIPHSKPAPQPES